MEHSKGASYPGFVGRKSLSNQPIKADHDVIKHERNGIYIYIYLNTPIHMSSSLYLPHFLSDSFSLPPSTHYQ